MDAQDDTNVMQVGPWSLLEFSTHCPFSMRLDKDGAVDSTGMSFGPAEPSQQAHKARDGKLAPDLPSAEARPQHRESSSEMLLLDSLGCTNETDQSANGHGKQGSGNTQPDEVVTTQDEVYNCGQCSQRFYSLSAFLMHACSSGELAEQDSQANVKDDTCKRTLKQEVKSGRHLNGSTGSRQQRRVTRNSQKQIISDEQKDMRAQKHIEKNGCRPLGRTLSQSKKTQCCKKRTFSRSRRGKLGIVTPAAEEESTRNAMTTFPKVKREGPLALETKTRRDRDASVSLLFQKSRRASHELQVYQPAEACSPSNLPHTEKPKRSGVNSELAQSQPRPFACSLCDKTYKRRSHLREHEKTHTQPKSESRPFACHICSKTYKRSSHLREHEKLHTQTEEEANARPFKCELCGKFFKRKSHLREHEKGVHAPGREKMESEVDSVKSATDNLRSTEIPAPFRPFQCSICSKSYILKKHLREHERTHGSRGFPCRHCAKSFFSTYQRKRHERTHSTFRPFACKLCSKTFACLGDCRRHEKRAHAPKKPFVRKSHRCDVCGKVLTSATNLKYHMKAHQGLKDYTCQYCGKCVTSRPSLLVHERIHLGIKKHKCEICGAAFIVKYHLKRHMIVHSKEERAKHLCGQCGKMFNQLASLKRHQILHTGSREHKCPDCGHAFYRSSDLKQHRQRVHQPRVFHQCQYCLQTFRSKASLERHEKTHGNRPCTSLLDSKDICPAPMWDSTTLQLGENQAAGPDIGLANTCSPEHQRLHDNGEESGQANTCPDVSLACNMSTDTVRLLHQE